MIKESRFYNVWSTYIYMYSLSPQASLDEPTHTVVMHRTEPTRLQSLALQLSEKVSSLVDNNERIMELKQGNLFFQKSGGSKYCSTIVSYVPYHTEYMYLWVQILTGFY